LSARHALLGLLHERPGYPYLLADRLSVRLGRGWQINSGQLYRTIDELEKDGLIERIGEPAGDRVEGRRHVYAITEAGEAEFRDWLGRVPKLGRVQRRPLLLKIALAGPDDVEDTLADIVACERQCVERMTEISRERDREPPEHWTWAERAVFRLSLNAEHTQVNAEFEFLREARADVSTMARAAAALDQREAPRQWRRAREDVFDQMASGRLRLACGGKQAGA
jgi:DNA-binding PadR family transcriptional regulator